ncbi:MAG: choice-of-anchor D domain-containing protein, partial [Rudaea sp.]
MLVAMLAPGLHAQSPKSAADDGGGAHILLTPQHGRSANIPQALQPLSPSGTASPNDLTYHGGKVMRNVTNYVIIWNPPTTTFSATYQQLIEQYFTDDGGTPFMEIETQWNDSSGTTVPNANHFGGTWVDTANAYPHAGTVSDPLVGQDIKDEVNRAIAANPTWQGPGYSTMYFVYLGHNIIECFKGAGDPFGCFAGKDINGASPPASDGPPNTVAGAGTYCAYHSSDGANIYATMPYAADGACGNQPAYPNGRDQDLVLSPTSHEQNEGYSDPNLDAWYNDTTGNENGDNCAYTYGQVEPDGTNFVLSGHRYQIQREWSNALPDGCIKRDGPASQLTLTGDLNFGLVPRCTTASKDVLIQNTAAGDLNLLNVRIDPASPPSFSLDPGSPHSGTLPSSDSVTVKVNFSPIASATSSSVGTPALIVDTDQPGQETQSISGSASIGLPNAVLSPASLNFSTVCPSSFSDQQVTVTNTGTAPLTISSVAIGGGSTPGLSVLSPPTLPQTLAVGAHLAFTIRFTPTTTTPGSISGNVVVTTDDPVHPALSIPISGTIGAANVTIGSSAL